MTIDPTQPRRNDGHMLEEFKEMGWFSEFRDEGWNTYYERIMWTTVVHIHQVVVAWIGLTLVVVLIILACSSRGKERISIVLRLLFNFHSGFAILICLIGNDWCTSSIRSHCVYSSIAPGEIYGDIGLKVGLKSLNVTLIATRNTTAGGENIRYNEEFLFSKATDMDDSIAHARERGVPHVIMYVAEYFDVDEGGLRWRRNMRVAGHFTYIVLWCAFCAWVVGSFLLGFVVSNGATVLALCGVMMIGACVLYHLLQPPSPLIVPFQDGYMTMEYGWCFWLTCGSGVVTFLYGISLLAFNSLHPGRADEVFLIERIDDDEEESRRADKSGKLVIQTPHLMRRRGSQPIHYTNHAFTANPENLHPDGSGRRYQSRKSSAISITRDNSNPSSRGQPAPALPAGNPDLAVETDYSDESEPEAENSATPPVEQRRRDSGSVTGYPETTAAAATNALYSVEPQLPPPPPPVYDSTMMIMERMSNTDMTKV